MRIVVDTNVLVRATKASTGPARELIPFFKRQQAVLVSCRYILSEVVRVIRYPRVQAMLGNRVKAAQKFAGRLSSLCELCPDPNPHTITSYSRDPKDEPIIQLAIDAKADVICTLDRHFRDPAVVKLLAGHGIRVLTDVEVLQELRQSNP